MARVTEQQLRSVVDQYGRSLILLARQWCNSPDDALQESLIDLARLAELPENPVAWLFRVVRNKAISQARSERRRDGYQQAAAEQRQGWFESDPSVGLDGERVARLLESLPEMERQIITCRVWGQLSFAEIAQLVDRPVANVFRTYRATLLKLREQLGLADKQPKQTKTTFS
ncbi:MAG: RNA polymerase sigma factor [Pirellulales bacterium]